MNLSAYKSRLTTLSKDLALTWQQTQVHWRDEKSRQFEHDYLAEMLAGVNPALNVIAELDELLTRIKKDCE